MLRRGRYRQQICNAGTGLFAALGCSYKERVKRAIFVFCLIAHPKGLSYLPHELCMPSELTNSQHARSVAALELAGCFDRNVPDHQVVDQHGIALLTPTHAACR